MAKSRGRSTSRAASPAKPADPFSDEKFLQHIRNSAVAKLTRGTPSAPGLPYEQARNLLDQVSESELLEIVERSGGAEIRQNGLPGTQQGTQQPTSPADEPDQGGDGGDQPQSETMGNGAPAFGLAAFGGTIIELVLLIPPEVRQRIVDSVLKYIGFGD